ncbi:MAG TPA: nitrite/sulfite reductase [Victivallales bacterium]|nr:nitrite/sulfite reductase [Victivallales bacterium]
MNNLILNEHFVLKEKISDYLSGLINYPALKAYTAPFGIYKQRDDKFMVRIRVTGGELSIEKYKVIIQIAEKYNIEFIHFSTRQAVQLHGINPEYIFDIIKDCSESGIYFKGGGGDTVRNIAACCYSGLTDKSLFDVLPHSKAMADYLYNYDKAYSLPRKIKFAFSCDSSDSSFAQYHDLGFFAKIKNSEKGFEVYSGGGMGRNSSPAIKIFDFIPECNFIHCAVAVTNLFYDHGNREKRNKARLRYVAQELGEKEYIDLFTKYYEKALGSNLNLPEYNLESRNKFDLFKELHPCSEINDNDFAEWKKRTVMDTIHESVALLKLFVPYGLVSIEASKIILNIAEITNLPYLRLTRNNDIFIPVKTDQLEYIYEMLDKRKGIYDFKADSFKGLVTSCIGAKTCAIGIIDPKPFADEITNAMGELSKQKNDIIDNIICNIKISGCPNCCSNHPVAKIGLQGCIKKDSEGKSIPHVKLIADSELLTNLGYCEDTYLKCSDMQSLIERVYNNIY